MPLEGRDEGHEPLVLALHSQRVKAKLGGLHGLVLGVPVNVSVHGRAPPGGSCVVGAGSRAGWSGGRSCRSGLRLRPLTHSAMELRTAGMRLAVARAASRRARAAGERTVAILVMQSVKVTTSSAEALRSRS